MKKSDAVVLFSSGIDSTTALYWALEKFDKVHTLSFSYSQKHSVEVEMAKIMTKRLGVEASFIEIPFRSLIKSALIDDGPEIPDSMASAKNEEGIPHTYVPFRNGIFISFAAAYAESRGITDIITGFNLIDTPDYPDTTGSFVEAMENAVNSGTSASVTGRKFKIHAPLIGLTKKEIIEMGLKLNADYSWSVTCYRGEEMPCLACPSCDSRNGAFKALGMEDPVITRLRKEGKI